MGVKGFYALFPKQKSLSMKDLAGKTVAIDALIEIYAASLALNSVNALTDKKGNVTTHINVVFYKILNMVKHRVNQIWVFDNSTVNPEKLAELTARRGRKDAAEAKLAASKPSETTKEYEELFGTSDALTEDQIYSYEKQAFTVTTKMIEEVKFILDSFDIKWIEASVGTEAECLVAKLVKDGVADYGLSKDPDTLLFGCPRLINLDKKTKKFNLWDLTTLLNESEITQKELIQVGIALGCDFLKDSSIFKGVGIKTVIKKVKSGKLNDKFSLAPVAKAQAVFENDCKYDPADIHNAKVQEMTDTTKIDKLVEWLTEKAFNLERIKKAIAVASKK
jgi:5'-3' exonuclease